MFSVAYVVLPISDTPPAEAIRASLARFQRGCRGDIPDEWLEFDDTAENVREAYEGRFIFEKLGSGGLRIGGTGDTWALDLHKVREEMKRRRLRSWKVRFADEMDMDQFYSRYVKDLERHPETGGFGQWLNGQGHWDWWDLGGSFDGRIVGDRAGVKARRKAQISSGASPGRAILHRITDVLFDALDQELLSEVDVRSDQNIELASRLLEDARADRENAYPGTLVLPPGVIEDSYRWLAAWPDLGPQEAFAWLGVPDGTIWKAICEAVYTRFLDHWVAAISYHH